MSPLFTIKYMSLPIAHMMWCIYSHVYPKNYHTTLRPYLYHVSCPLKTYTHLKHLHAHSAHTRVIFVSVLCACPRCGVMSFQWWWRCIWRRRLEPIDQMWLTRMWTHGILSVFSIFFSNQFSSTIFVPSRGRRDTVEIRYREKGEEKKRRNDD